VGLNTVHTQYMTQSHLTEHERPAGQIRSKRLKNYAIQSKLTLEAGRIEVGYG